MELSPIPFADVSPYRFENPFVQHQSKLPDNVVNEYARQGVVGFFRDDERVTISRRELNEYVQSRKHAEDMLDIIKKLELNMQDKDSALVMLRAEWDNEVYTLKRAHAEQCGQFEGKFEMCESHALSQRTYCENIRKQHDEDLVKAKQE